MIEHVVLSWKIPKYNHMSPKIFILVPLTVHSCKVDYAWRPPVFCAIARFFMTWLTSIQQFPVGSRHFNSLTGCLRLNCQIPINWYNAVDLGTVTLAKSKMKWKKQCSFGTKSKIIFKQYYKCHLTKNELNIEYCHEIVIGRTIRVILICIKIGPNRVKMMQ